MAEPINAGFAPLTRPPGAPIEAANFCGLLMVGGPWPFVLRSARGGEVAVLSGKRKRLIGNIIG
jgi:hypothetical protein